MSGKPIDECQLEKIVREIVERANLAASRWPEATRRATERYFEPDDVEGA
jgi:Glu-tRNA(Gln) amidotransferase subunit E-like FAD-binding protein